MGAHAEALPWRHLPFHRGGRGCGEAADRDMNEEVVGSGQDRTQLRKVTSACRGTGELWSLVDCRGCGVVSAWA